MPKRKTERIAAMKAALDSGTLPLHGAPLTLGIELPADPSAGWDDDDDVTKSGPVDDLQPIGRVTPVPSQATEAEQLRAIEHYEATGQVEFAEGAREGLRLMAEADEEPTLLGPNPTITEDDGEIDTAEPCPPQWQVGIDWAAFELERKRVEFIDATAIALYGRGFPVVNCYTKAKLLWEQRCKEGIR